MTGVLLFVAQLAQGGHLTRRPFLVREPAFRQASVAITSCLRTTIRAIAKEHRNVSYGKNLHIAVVVVFVVVVHGCERNARRQSVITAWHGGQSEWLSTCFFPVKDVVCYYLLSVPRHIIYT